MESKPGSYEMIFGKRAFFGYALAPSGEVWWFANVPQPREPARGEVQAIDPEEWRQRLLGLFADDAGPAVRPSRRHRGSARPAPSTPSRTCRPGTATA